MDKEYKKKVDAIIADFPDQTAFSWHTPKEGRKQIARLCEIQHELHLIQKDILQTKREIHQSYIIEKSYIDKTERIAAENDRGVEIISGKVAGKLFRYQHDHAREKEQEKLIPYEEAEKYIEDILEQCTRIIQSIEEGIGAQRVRQAQMKGRPEIKYVAPEQPPAPQMILSGEQLVTYYPSPDAPITYYLSEQEAPQTIVPVAPQETFYTTTPSQYPPVDLATLESSPEGLSAIQKFKSWLGRRFGARERQ